jgi:hypothetical protein
MGIQPQRWGHTEVQLGFRVHTLQTIQTFLVEWRAGSVLRQVHAWMGPVQKQIGTGQDPSLLAPAGPSQLCPGAAAATMLPSKTAGKVHERLMGVMRSMHKPVGLHACTHTRPQLHHSLQTTAVVRINSYSASAFCGQV